MLSFAMNYPVAIKYFVLLLPFIYPSDESTSTLLSNNWSYNDKNIWELQYERYNGSLQSPIALDSLFVTPGYVPPLTFGSYDELLAPFTLENNGHTIEGLVNITQFDNNPYITGGFLNGIFEVVNIHFHWGSQISRGSEHTINGVRYDVELHIVHKNQKYESVDEAREHKDGLAVLGIMIKADRRNNGDSVNDAYNRIFSRVPSLTQYNSKLTVEDTFPLNGLLGTINTKYFYTYNGSLTTPPFSEAVTWHVFPEPIAVPYNLISRFFNVRDSNNNVLLNNYRSLRPRNFRPVYLRRQSILQLPGVERRPLLDLPVIGPIF